MSDIKDKGKKFQRVILPLGVMVLKLMIQNTAIRVGNERDEFESQEVVGASTLKIKNIKIS